MTRADATGWLRKNIPALVTWALLLLTAAAALGGTSTIIGTVEDDVATLKLRDEKASVERATTAADVRVQAERHDALAARVDRFERVVDRIEVAARRLEAIGETFGRGAPR